MRGGQQAQPETVKKVVAADERPKGLTLDAFVNPFSRLGPMEPNQLEASTYVMTRMTEDYALLNTMYRTDWIARKVIDTIPEDMVKNWIDMKSQMDPDMIEQFDSVIRKTHVKERLLEGLKWGRLFGGAAGIMVIAGQEDMLDQPLDLRTVVPDSFVGLIIADRWSGVYPSTELVQDLADPDFGLPEYYNFAMSETDLANGVKVHHSRVLRFIGRDLPYIERMSEIYWGMSELEHIYDELNKRNSASENIGQLIYQANIRTYKMADLGQTLMMTDPQSQRELYRTMSMQNFLMTNMSLNVMDKDDDLQTSSYTFTGLSDVYELFMADISGAAEIPATRLFGRSPAGMNATGESDLRNYYDKVKQLQEARLRPVLEKLLPVMCCSVFGAVPDDLDFEFKPVRDVSDEERANLIQQSSGSIVSVFQAGLISQKTALKELRESGASYGMWSNITDEDIDNADDSTGAEGDEMGMGMPGMEGMGGMMPGMPGAEGAAPGMEMPEAEPEEEPEAMPMTPEEKAAVRGVDVTKPQKQPQKQPQKPQAEPVVQKRPEAEVAEEQKKKGLQGILRGRRGNGRGEEA